MDTRLEYICGIISILLAFSPIPIWARFALGGLGIFALITAYIHHGRTSLKNGDREQKQRTPGKRQTNTFQSDKNHNKILIQFGKHDGEHLSTPTLQELTGLEPLAINSALDDLVKHGLVRRPNLVELEGGWQYILSDIGRKYILKNQLAEPIKPACVGYDPPPRQRLTERFKTNKRNT
jgi:hypothetical protein